MEGYTTMGASRDQTLTLNRQTFSKNLRGLVAAKDSISPFEFFQMVHIAFDRCLDRKRAELLFYHIHNPDSWALLNYLRFQPESGLLLSVREPLQSCESWIEGISYDDAVRRVHEFLFAFDKIEFKYHDARGIRLEDLKLDTDNTLKFLCQWMQIDDHECLRFPTFQGLEYWGDPSSVKFGRTEPVIGFQDDRFDPQTDPIKRKVGFLFSARDQLILRTLLYPVRVLYRYQEPDATQFTEDMKTIGPMLKEPLDFERKLFDAAPARQSGLDNNIYHRFFQNALRDRWETLDSCGTYPNMIKPLFEGNIY
jgi:hypothetical protein